MELKVLQSGELGKLTSELEIIPETLSEAFALGELYAELCEKGVDVGMIYATPCLRIAVKSGPVSR